MESFIAASFFLLIGHVDQFDYRSKKLLPAPSLNPLNTWSHISDDPEVEGSNLTGSPSPVGDDDKLVVALFECSRHM